MWTTFSILRADKIPRDAASYPRCGTRPHLGCAHSQDRDTVGEECPGPVGFPDSGSWNRSSTEQPKVLEIFKARTVEGTYTPFSMALMLFRETSAASESSCCVSPATLRNDSKLFKRFWWFLPNAICARSGQRHS